MNLRIQLKHIATFAITAAILTGSTTSDLFAQEKTAEPQLTWSDLGFNGFPENLSTDEIAVVESLNRGRGEWTFEMTGQDREKTQSVQGKLEIQGSAKLGMIPGWGLTLYWPIENPENMVHYAWMIVPEKDKIEMMLFQIGPIKVGSDGKPTKDAMMKAQRKPFRGIWNPARRTVLWQEKELPKGLPVKTRQDESEIKEKGSFEMVLQSNGEITIQNHTLVSNGPGISGKATARISKPLAEEKLYFNKDIHFATFSDILEPHIKRFVPPNAVNITLYLQRNGHFANYKVSEEDFINFLNVLWEKDKWEKGKAVSKTEMAKQFQKLGWDPLENAISYSSPIQPNGAMTNYYFDAKAGIAYENTGYW